ncbi:MAG: S41 family peptidase [Acidobacteriota bacterium]|nr:S41 family peptidase [Acidobacteriota bacterium]
MTLFCLGLLSAFHVSSRAATCPELAPTRQVSFHGQESRLFDRLLETIRRERGSIPAPLNVLETFGACLEVIDGEPELQSLHWQVDSRRRQLTVRLGNDFSRSYRITPRLARLARQVVSHLVESRQASDSKLRNALWYLWFESTLRATGERFDRYEFARQTIASRAASRGRSFSVGFAAARQEDHFVVTMVHDPELRRAGLRSGMKITRLDGRPPQTLDPAEVANYWLRDRPFTYTFDALNGGASLHFEADALARQHRTLVHIEGDGVTYVGLRRFSQRSLLELRRVLRDAERISPRGLIVDLRGNPGGVASPGLVDLFLKPGEIAITYQEWGEEEIVNWYGTIEFYDIPLVLLVDRHTASMAEALAAAIATYRRGTLVGETTFGKGVGQAVFEILDEGILLLVDRTLYYPGTRRSWNGEGIAVDVPVAISDEIEASLDRLQADPLPGLDRLAAQDPALQRAIDLLLPAASPPEEAP